MKIAFTAGGSGWDSPIDPRFGRAEYILIYDDQTDELIALDNRDIEAVAHGAGTKTAKLLFEAKPDVLITGNGPGENAAIVLAQMPLKIYIGAKNKSVREAYEAFQKHELSEY